MKSSLVVKILQEGDQVLNVWHSEGEIYVVVKKPSGAASIYSIGQDEAGQPRLSSTIVSIEHGDGSVEALATDQNGVQVFSLTA